MVGYNPISFAWGYDLPAEDADRVRYSAICEMLSSEALDPTDAFYLSEVGVAPKLQGRGFGTRLIERLDDRLVAPTVVMRTKNPAMLRVAEKAWGGPLMEFAEESAYAGGRAYVFDRGGGA